MGCRSLIRLVVISLGLVVVGAALAIYGLKEKWDAEGTTPEPVEVDLARLEEGKVPDNRHVRVGPHVALYYGTIYSYTQKRRSRSKVEPATRLTYCYYPIISMSNPAAQALMAESKKAAENKPDDTKPDAAEEDEPELPETFAVIVKTKRFKTVKDIPDDLVRREDAAQGMVFNKTRPLDYKEKTLLQESFPKANLDKLVVLEEGRTPMSPVGQTGFMIAGGLVALGGVAFFVLGLVRGAQRKIA
jgi:hypothetical protein